VLRQILLVPVTSFLVGMLLLSAIGRRPELIERGSNVATDNATILGFLDQWRKAANADERDRIVEAARQAGFNTEKLRAAGRRLGIDGKEAREALDAWAEGMPGYDPAARAASAAGEEGRDIGVNALAVGATTLIGLPPVLVGLGLRRRLRPEVRATP
jgi:hypothetical protein